MKLLRNMVIVTMVLGLMGCGAICKFNANQQAQVSGTLQALQFSYNAIVTILKVTPRPEVQIAVALTDAALHLVGSVLASSCPSQSAIALAQATAKSALAAQSAVLGAVTVPVK